MAANTSPRQPQTPFSARSVALSVLAQSVDSDEGVDVLLDRALRLNQLDNRDRGLALDLTYGVLRRLGTIDWRLDPLLDKPITRLPTVVQMLIRLGAYQVLFLDRIPHSAAVNESVKVVKSMKNRLKRDWSGFVNAVLRRLIRDPAPPWPSLETDTARYLAVKHSVPEWLSRRWIDRVGVEIAERVCEQATNIPPVTLRVNRLKTTREELLARFVQGGIAVRATQISPVGISLEHGGPITSLPGFDEGLFYVEDEAAQLIPPILDPKPGDVIFDACAAPGGKATHMAELIGNRGVVYAVDRKGARLELLKGNCRRLGISIVTPVVGDVRHSSIWQKQVLSRHQQFDRILVDAPCSGLGVLRRHPEAKWRKDSAAFGRHHRLQVDILRSAASRLRPGGVLVYSTCSTEPEENETVIEQFLKSHAEFHRESSAPWIPAAGEQFLTRQGDLSTMGNRAGMDGFYAARLKRAT